MNHPNKITAPLPAELSPADIPDSTIPNIPPANVADRVISRQQAQLILAANGIMGHEDTKSPVRLMHEYGLDAFAPADTPLGARF